MLRSHSHKLPNSSRGVLTAHFFQIPSEFLCSFLQIFITNSATGEDSVTFFPLVPVHVGLHKAGFEEVQEYVLTRCLITKSHEQGLLKSDNYFILLQDTNPWSRYWPGH